MEMIYESIEDLPIWNWNKIHEKSDFTYLRVNRINGKVLKEHYHTLKKAWDKVYDEYINQFGFSEELLNQHQKIKEIALYKAQKIETGDQSLNTMIEIAEKELVGMRSAQNKGGDFWQSKATIEELLGFQIDAKKTSVVEFYSYVRNLKNRKSSGRRTD